MIAAILFYKPIFTQPLGFVVCAAGAVEKPAQENEQARKEKIAES